MTGTPFGAIVLTDFPFTNLSAAKRRPALVVSTDNDRRTEVVVAYITSVPLATQQDAAPIARISHRAALPRSGEELN